MCRRLRVEKTKEKKALSRRIPMADLRARLLLSVTGIAISIPVAASLAEGREEGAHGAGGAEVVYVATVDTP
ncbi:hypothetical protein N7468_008641 [Penicillium chermesinum]|uniref:Uncharacterized protein n=1 Tax=Penicillium chermesinum TaxID=63820 RepID=A0A9W9NQ68_9EURO|nr:uncharacterized protein N7468_008641 [Penicillium chermesinum]KAJ5224099.1 hypothetical protein N7468_008641 [Penicillium chermesinum]